MHFDYISACVDCVDLLSTTYQHNKTEFDRFTIVTAARDKDTQQFCADNGINCVVTDLFYYGGRKFDRGLALNAGLATISGNADWVAHLDCDIIMPKDWRKNLPQLNQEWFYGAQRFILENRREYEEWLAGKFNPEPLEGFGYGYLQLWNWNSAPIRNAKGNYWYPASPNGDATESDWMFRLRWGDFDGSHAKWKGNFDRLPFNVAHLGMHGTNNQGRKSEKF